MTLIADTFNDENVIQALAVDRAREIFRTGVVNMMKADLDAKAKEVINLVWKYQQDGAGYGVLKSLTDLRNERLAHRKPLEDAVADMGASAADKGIEGFYLDTSTIIHKLLSLILGIAHDPAQTADIFRSYATHFWAAARGEKTKGHLDYKPRPHGP